MVNVESRFNFIKRKDNVLKFEIDEQKIEKFEKLVVALSTNNFGIIDSIVDSFSKTDENEFQAYLNSLQPHEIDPTKISSMNSFISTMFTYYCKPKDESGVANEARNKSRIKY